MKAAIIIPARYKSSRYPGKPLVELNGRTMIQRVWDIACKVPEADGVWVATDDDRIADHVREFGGKVVMTPESCENGTARCAAAIEALDIAPNVVVNLQGDSPVTPIHFISNLINAMLEDPLCQMATPGLQMTEEMFTLFREDRMAGRVGGTTVVFDKNRDALYFSKEVIPFMPQGVAFEDVPAYHHVGLYAYTPNLLRKYVTWTEGPLEKMEKLEQLRVLEHGHKIRVVTMDEGGKNFWEVNNPEDVKRVEGLINKYGEPV